MEKYVGVGITGIILMGLTVLIGFCFITLEKRGVKIPFNFECFVSILMIMLFLFGCLLAAVPIIAKFDPDPQTIIVMDHTGEVIAEYKNDDDNLSYAYNDGKIKIKSGDKQYVYYNVTVEIILEDTKP